MWLIPKLSRPQKGIENAKSIDFNDGSAIRLNRVRFFCLW